MSDQKIVRLNVNLSEETAAALKQMAERERRSITETIRRCIAVTDYLDSERAAGRIILTSKDNGRDQRELRFL